jgi:hypothetical protein
MTASHDILHLIYLFQVKGSWYGSPAVLRVPPSKCTGSRLDIIDGLKRYKAIEGTSLFASMWRDDMPWIQATQPLKTARLLVQAGHYVRAFETIPSECRKNASEIGAFLGVPMGEAEQVFAARIPAARKYDKNAYPAHESQHILSAVHTLLRRYERGIVPEFEVEQLRVLLDSMNRKPWKKQGAKHISAKVSDEVFSLLETQKGSRSAKMRWAILESWAKGPLPPKDSWRNLPRPQVCCLKTDASMFAELYREAKAFNVVVGAVIEEHCHRGLG